VRLVQVLGRRTLMLIGLGGMFLFYTVMTIAFCFESSTGMKYVAVVATLTLVVFFMIGPGAIPWFITAEMFSQGPRPAACAVAATVNWATNFIIGIAFPSMQSKRQGWLFYYCKWNQGFAIYNANAESHTKFGILTLYFVVERFAIPQETGQTRFSQLLYRSR
ncbi:predicted protein, partial [Nematostella vectensis]